jgi:SRSO17 transposase
VRRSIEDPDDLTAYTVFSPEGTTLEELAKAAGSRWRVGRSASRRRRGKWASSHYEVRSWHGWYRHIALALFAHAFLEAIRAKGRDIEASQAQKRAPKTAATNSLSAFKRGRGLSWD